MFNTLISYFSFLVTFHNKPQGAVCIFSIKNPSFPEHICLTTSCCMCIDIHPKYPFMVVVGLYDGSVCVYNVTIDCERPQYKSNSVENKHRGIVWQVSHFPGLFFCIFVKNITYRLLNVFLRTSFLSPVTMKRQLFLCLLQSRIMANTMICYNWQ